MKKIVLISILCLLAANAAFAANSIAVTAAAAMGPNNGGTACGGGMCGLAVTLDGSTNPAKVVDNTPNNEAPYRADFWIDPTGLTMNQGNIFVVARGTQQNTTPIKAAFQVLVMRDQGIFRYSLRAETNNPNPGISKISPRINHDNDCGGARLQIEFEKSPAPATPGGEVTLTLLEVENPGGACSMVPGTFVNTAMVHGEGINNSNLDIDDHHFGAIGGPIPATASGTFFLDEHRAFRTLAP